MVLRVLDPIAKINTPPAAKPLRGIESLTGKRVGLLWGRHAATVKFWPVIRGSRARPLQAVGKHTPV
jgi:hypothetical protein